MREDKHTVLGKLLSVNVHPPGPHVQFTIPSREECAEKASTIYRVPAFNSGEAMARFARWFLTYAITGEDPDKVEKQETQLVASCRFHYRDKEGERIHLSKFDDIIGIEIDEKYYSMDTLKERLK